MARWPAALEPWLDAATRDRRCPLSGHRAAAGAQAPEAGLQIVGVSDGDTIRRAGNGPAPELRLEARGGQDELIWLLERPQIGRVPAGRALQQRFSEAGRYQITVMDDAGRYDRVEISVR
jgi:penicillin-binding protein 1C